jgi:hypothetical protein
MSRAKTEVNSPTASRKMRDAAADSDDASARKRKSAEATPSQARSGKKASAAKPAAASKRKQYAAEELTDMRVEQGEIEVCVRVRSMCMRFVAWPRVCCSAVLLLFFVLANRPRWNISI